MSVSSRISNAWYFLTMPCPLCAAEGKYTSEEWIHGDCGGKLWIDCNAIVHCNKCGRQAHISTMEYTCNCGHHIRDFASPKLIGGALAIGKVGCEDGKLGWFKELLNNL